MKIRILAKTPGWLHLIWTAGRTCKSYNSPSDIFDAPISGERMVKFALALAKAGHLSVFEHVSVTFAISGVSRSLLTQYSRHRIAVSISAQSQRYVDYQDPTSVFVLPGPIDSNIEQKEFAVYALNAAFGFYRQLRDMGVKPEDARCVLPNAMRTNFVTTVNLRSLLDLYNKRVRVPGAQAEIRELVSGMAREVVKQEPWTESLFHVV